MNLKNRIYALWVGRRHASGEACVPKRAQGAALVLVVSLLLESICGLSAATVPAGFAETVIAGPSGGGWSDAVGLTFENNGRLYVWERTGRIWFKDPSDVSFTLLLDISEEVGVYVDHGCLGFALDPDFRVNGYIYLLYVVDRHHLLNFGTPGYNPGSNQYNAATIGRLTRYSCRASDGFRSVNLASRLILIGETKQTGIPMCSETHGVGSLVFGEDGTLLVSCGDGASPYGADLGGTWTGSYAPQALADGIIKPKENVGSLRCQLVDSLDGKVLRVDPATGDGVPSNPYYDAGNPRAPRSRVWALGLRNPYRMVLKPESGSHNPADGKPGVLYIGDVGWETWECLKVVTGPRQNFGWPLYEGLGAVSYFYAGILNQDAPNPLYPSSGCNPYFAFEDLLKEDTLAAAGQPPFNNPCNTSQKIPSAIPQFLHARPVLDWNHASTTTRTPTYGPAGQAQTANVGAGGSPVSGTQFQGNCAIGGTWYTGTNFPAQYQNRYYFADWGQGLIKSLTFGANDKPVALGNFASAAGYVASVVENPIDGSLYYITYNYNSAAMRKISYAGNRTPIAVASADKFYGPTPLAVQFSSGGSGDPDGQAITYSWNFGDGSPVSSLANPSHSFSAPAGVPTKFIVTLTVSDGSLSSQATLIVSANNTPPNVTITSPVDGTLYSPNNATTVNLSATVSDAESSDSQLLYQWQTLLHHNAHNHGSPENTNHVTTTVTSPTGCDGVNIFYHRILLTVTDPAGLSTTREVRLYPNCGPNTPPTISAIANQTILQNGSTAAIPFTVGDGECAAANLQLSASSSNPTLVPNGNIVFGGSGSNRTVTVSPAGGQTGTTTISVTVNDGPNNTSRSFLLTVNPSVSGTSSFTNATAITIPNQGAGTPYPSTINVVGMNGTATNVAVTLRNLTHTWKADVDVLLVSPGGQKVMLMSDAGSTYTASGTVTITLSDAAAASLPASSSISSGTYKPTDYAPADTLPTPAPAGPYGTAMSVFNGTGANGAWSLYVFDDGSGDQGSFAGGWSLTVTTVSASGSSAPTISDIPDQSTTVNTPTAAIPFTINDADTPIGSLTLKGNSSNLTLVPTNNIVFGASGTNRTVTVTPAAGQTGTATITVTVNDGTNSASDTFVLTVNTVNTPPTITGIADQTINEDTATAALSFTIGDAETSPGSLALSKGSSNPALVPANNILFGGSGANRTVTVTPAVNQNGSATITLGVSDGQFVVSTNFVLTVNAVNDAPTITGIANQTINVNTSTGPLSFTIGDVDTAVGSLTLSGDSSNPTLVPTNNIVFGGSGTSRTVTVTPASNQTGSATITVSVSDGQYVVSSNFVVTVSTLFTGTKLFTNAAAITIPTFGSATPYPSTIDVTGMQGVASNVTVTLNGISHARMRDLDVLLVGPTGQNLILLSDVGPNGAVNNITLTLSDTAAPSIGTGTIVSGTYKPTNIGTGDTFLAPAPTGPYGTNLSVFKGTGANGTWSLYLVDDTSKSSGTFAGGWSLAVTTVSSLGSAVPTISDIPNQSTTVNTPTAAIPFTINDADTPVGSLILSATSSNPALAPTNNIVFGGSGTNRTVTVTPVTGLTGSATITVSVSDGTNNASDSFVLTVNAVNTPPTITSIADQTINEDTPTAALGFTIGDAETAAGSLTLSKGSSNPGLVPTNNIVYGGSGANRTVTVTPTANQNGSATISVSVSDGQYVASTNFVVTVSAVNDAPTITGIANQTINVNGTAGPLNFTIGDVDTAVGTLALDKNSSNPTLVPTNNIVLGGSGANRTVTVTPASNQTGSATITLSVSDGQYVVGTNFVLTVSTLFTGTNAFTNSAAITIPDQGAGTPYPSVINVAGLGGTITNVTVTLRSWSHTWKSDVDVVLVSPGGQKVMVMSDAGSTYTASGSVTITLSDAAAAGLPVSAAISSGTYKPTNYTDTSPGGDNFPAPAPGVPYSTALSAFNGQAANGAWSLYVFDDGPGDLGSFAGGWSLTIATASAAARSSAAVEEPPQITAVVLDGQGAIRVTVCGSVGVSYALEASSDLLNWTKVNIQENTTGSVEFIDQPTTNAVRFYRAASIPN